MTLQELLKNYIQEDTSITKLLEEMKTNKIFTANEENLDTRYAKLKGDFDALTKKSKEDTNLIDELRKSSKDNEDMQAKFTERDNRVAQLEAENKQLRLDAALKVELLSGKAKATDIDYLMYKIKQEKKELALDENGKIKGFDVKDIKTAYPNNFEVETKKEVDVNNLPNIKDKDVSVTKEQFEKMSYNDKNKLYREDPDTYKALRDSE